MQPATKKSKQRDAIIKFLMTRKDHPTADMVYMNIKEEFPKISLGPLRCMHRSTLSFCVSGMWSSHRFGDGTDR